MMIGDIKINGKFDKYKVSFGLLVFPSLFLIQTSSGETNFQFFVLLVQMAYIPQHDEYFEDLTCLETLTYASKLKNGSASIEDTLLTLNNDVIGKLILFLLLK